MMYLAYVKSKDADVEDVMVIVPLVDTKEDALAALAEIGITADKVTEDSHFVEQANFEANVLPDKSIDFDLWDY